MIRSKGKMIALFSGGILLGVVGFHLFSQVGAIHELPLPRAILKGRTPPSPLYLSSSRDDAGTGRQVAQTEEITDSRRNAIVLAAEKVSPSVISISVIQTRVFRSDPFPLFGDPFFDEFFKDFYPPRVYKQQIQSLGSGVIIDREGSILTNEHVIHDEEEIKVTLPDGREFDGKILGADPSLDLALLKIEGKDLPFALLGDSDDLIIGEWSIALGNPFGYLLEDTQPSVTVGVISALHREIKSRRGQVQVFKDMVQTDAAINPGNSGGPLVNANGEVIGINTFIFTAGGGSEGIGFARPINDAKWLIEEIVQHGDFRRVWIGLHVQKITSLLAESMDLVKVDGFLVAHVDERSPAEKAGIEPGDVLYEVNGKKVGDEKDWRGFLKEARVGEKVRIVGERKGKRFETTLVVEEMPG